ncbi:hypothetical protein D0T50_12295 [Bacteroides sp. 214]|uniref:tetratricopeptide repeat protein n=1 Tax=Bacteroides sp. 214 TaxID=2302935 RepID=UPI0013D5E268|nr:tetratricopeptide repeat protein [Bacteroides sp. 214]NDW13664.1 hypothetical protein [Bacteroides sp. 214]
MKHILYTILLYIFIFFLSACADHKVNTQLREAELLIENQPDSALTLLLSINDAKQLEGKDRADYALLLTKANDKNYILHNSDSLIKIAVDYYAASRNKERKAEAYFYLGSVYRDMDLRPEAIKAFQEALRINNYTRWYI